MTPIRFRVFGTPEGQPRIKATKLPHMAHVRIYTPKTKADFKSDVMIQARAHKPAMPLQGPLRVDVTGIFARPKHHFRTGKNAGILKDDAPHYHTAKPDRDNLDKLVLDALSNVGFWQDDKQACAGEIVKRYAAVGEETGAEICVSELTAATRGEMET